MLSTSHNVAGASTGADVAASREAATVVYALGLSIRWIRHVIMQRCCHVPSNLNFEAQNLCFWSWKGQQMMFVTSATHQTSFMPLHDLSHDERGHFP